MYKHVKSKVKLHNVVSEGFEYMLGIRQGECLSPFLFDTYLNDLEEEFRFKDGNDGIDIGMLKIFLLLYADDIILFAKSSELQKSSDTLFVYCQRYKLSVNTSKTKVIVLRKGGILPRDLKFYYNGKEINIVNTFSYLGVVLSASGSFSDCQKTLSGQAQKAIFKLNGYLYTFTNITPKHRL